MIEFLELVLDAHKKAVAIMNSGLDGDEVMSEGNEGETPDVLPFAKFRSPQDWGLILESRTLRAQKKEKRREIGTGLMLLSSLPVSLATSTAQPVPPYPVFHFSEANHEKCVDSKDAVDRL